MKNYVINTADLLSASEYISNIGQNTISTSYCVSQAIKYTKEEAEIIIREYEDFFDFPLKMLKLE